MPRTLNEFSINDENKPRYAARSKRFKDLEELPPNHWRRLASKPFIDYSKRVVKNPWCISEENIVSGKRRRAKVTYTEEERIRHDVDSQEDEEEEDCMPVTPVKKTIRKTRKSKIEERLVQEKLEQEEKVQDEKQYEDEEEECDEMDTSISPEKQPLAEQEKRKEDAFSQEIMDQIKRLGGKLSENSNSRPYLDYSTNMPFAIQQFCDIEWKHPCFNSQKYCLEIELAGEFALDRSELADIPLLKEKLIKSDYILIGDGTTLIVARNTDHSQDPVIYLAADEETKHAWYNKPIRMSEFLSALEADHDQVPTMFQEEEEESLGAEQ